MFYFLLFFFLATVVTYMWMQFFSLFYERHFRIIVGILLAQALLGFALVQQLFSTTLMVARIFGVVVAFWAVVTGILALIKVFYLEYLKMHNPKFITRARVDVGIEHEDITLKTQDNVLIRGFHIQKGNPSVVILAHGGSRCKNSFENVGIAEWLSYDYDVISYDTRGHFDSGGYWTGDGKTKLDLLAALEYARESGYQKVGVVGRSLGGWSAMLVAADHGGIDSLFIISAPLGHIRDTPLVSKVENLKSYPGRLLVKALQGLRYHDYNDNSTKTPADVASQITTPIYIVYGENDNVLGLSKQDILAFFAKIGSKNKKMYMFEGTVHLPYHWHLGPLYKMCLEWFKTTLE